MPLLSLWGSEKSCALGANPVRAYAQTFGQSQDASLFTTGAKHASGTLPLAAGTQRHTGDVSSLDEISSKNT
jgi:hypothetical protein